jgi:RNA polymerase sigma-70 factor (ECF subfamily)
MTLIDNEHDKTKFREIYDSLERMLFALSMQRLHNTALAEEAVSETFLVLAENFKKIHSFETDEIKAYTVIINRNLCFDILKKEKKQSSAISFDERIEIIPDEDSGSSGSSDSTERLENLIVAESVEKLPDIYRDVIMLKYFYNFKIKEISKQLHLSAGGVKSRLERARRLLRKELKKR